MPRPKKESHAFNIRMEKKVYQRLVRYCDEKGQTLTTAVERILTEKFDQNDHAKKQQNK
ncbi:MAG: hypothetical protein VZT48_01875 [Bulleidia sp.]|nr:hypothetical protein [Bulleidia sp.]